MKVPNFKFAIREDLKDDDRFLPTRADEEATGWDVAAGFGPQPGVGSVSLPGYIESEKAKIMTIYNREWVKIPLGIRCFAPKGWWLELRPRSSTTAKKNLHCLYGVIDESYSGELIFCGQYLPTDANSQLTIELGDKIGQLVPVKRQNMTVEKVSNEEFYKLVLKRNASRGDGGFGSTDKKVTK